MRSRSNSRNVTKRQPVPINAELVGLAHEVIDSYETLAHIRDEAAKARANEGDKSLPVEVAQAHAVLAERADEAILAAELLHQDALARFRKKHGRA